MPVNAIRGEVELLIDGKAHCLCLTLGALAEIETALELSGMGELGTRLQHISANDVVVILSALLGGGGCAVSPKQLRQAKLDPGAVAEVIAKTFSHAGNEK